jgi:hypothetical protein
MVAPSRLETILGSLADIYETVNVVQSVVIVDDDDFEELFEELVADDYPVARYPSEEEVESFVGFHSRMLLVPLSDVNHFAVRYTMICAYVNVFLSASVCPEQDYTDLDFGPEAMKAFI